MTNPLKHWKLSPVDQKAQEMWDQVTYYKEEMFSRTHTSYAPWIIVNSNDKKSARLESIRYLLSQLPYDGKRMLKSIYTMTLMSLAVTIEGHMTSINPCY